MRFTSESHQARYYAMLDEIRPDLHDERCKATIYTLSTIEKSTIADYVTRTGINFDGLIVQSKQWSEADQTMVSFAATLYNPQRWPITVDGVFSVLEQEETKIALEAIEICYEGH